MAETNTRFVVVATMDDEIVPSVWTNLYSTLDEAKAAVLSDYRDMSGDKTVELDWDVEEGVWYVIVLGTLKFSIAQVNA